MLARRMRVRTFILLLVLGSPLGLLGITPAVAADDCGPAGCIENCRAGVATGSAYAFCDVGHQPRGADTCDMLAGPCGNTVIVCSVDTTRCDVYQQPLPSGTQCVPVFPDGEFEFGVCAAAYGDDCMVWTYSRFGEQCQVDRFVN